MVKRAKWRRQRVCWRELSLTMRLRNGALFEIPRANDMEGSREKLGGDHRNKPTTKPEAALLPGSRSKSFPNFAYRFCFQVCGLARFRARQIRHDSASRSGNLAKRRPHAQTAIGRRPACGLQTTKLIFRGVQVVFPLK